MRHIEGSGRFDQDVVGEEHYQEALIRIAGPYTQKGHRVRCEAVLYLQPDNPHDGNAIRIEIDGSTVGYISRYQAPTLRRQMQRLGIGNGQRVTVDAAIGGGRIGTRYGVYLDFDMPDDPQDNAVPYEPLPTIKPTKHGASAPAPTGWASPDERKPLSRQDAPPFAWPKEPSPEPAASGSSDLLVIGIISVVCACSLLLYTCTR